METRGTVGNSSRKRLLLLESVRLVSSFEAIITKVTAGLQVPILYSTSVEHSAILLKRIAIQYYKLNSWSPVIRHIQRTNDLKFQQRYVLLGLPKVGIKRADELLKRFGSLHGVFLASEEELAETPEIGPQVAKTLKQVLSARFCDSQQ